MLKNGISILIITNLLFADYYISFDFSSKNGVLTSYNFNCSKTMTTNFENKKLLFILDTKYNSVKEVCKYQQSEIINQLLKYMFNVTSYEKKLNNYIFFKTKGVFLPKRFDIIIRDKKAYFYLKENN